MSNAGPSKVLCYRRAWAGLAILTAAVACASPSPSNAARSDAIVGGVATTQANAVVVADAHDRYVCTGVLVRDDVVLVAADGECIDEAAAIYVDFNASVDRTATLAPVAGNASMIPLTSARASLASTPLRSGVIRAVAPAISSTDIAAAPSVGTACEVVGHGPDGTNARVGVLRRARCASLPSWAGRS